MKKIAISMLLLILLFMLRTGSQGSAATVKCAIPNFEPAYEQAGAVFVGKVVSKKTEESTKVFEFEVEKYWKGVEDRKITVYVNENLRFQAQFKVGETYLVFADKDEDDEKLYDRRCSRTKLIQSEYGELKKDLEKLGKAKTCISLGSN